MRWLPLAVVLASGLIVALPVAAWSGATQGQLLENFGPLVRWGMILAGVLHDVAAAATVGLLVVGGFLVPEGRHSARRELAGKAASLTAVVWALATAVKLVLSFAEGSNQSLRTPGFLDDLLANLFSISLFTYQAVELILVGAVILVAGMSRGRNGLAWAAALAVGALMPMAYTGHSGGAEGHETAVTALGLHLVGVSLWAGGLIALLMLAPELGKALKITVERYSTMALWSFIAVAFSGVLFALQSADNWSDLTSNYWLLIFAKVALMFVLGWFGYTQRGRIVARGVDKPGAFIRLATSEIVVMAVTIGVAVTLSRTPTPPLLEPGESDPAFALTGFYAPPPLQASSWLTVWELNWLFLLGALMAVGLYLAGVIKLRRRGDRWPISNTILWIIGWLIFVYITNGAPGVYGRVMFSMHMVMHMALMMAMPIFLVLGTPITLALRALPKRKDKTLGPREVLLAVVHSRYAAFIANPVVAGVLFFGSLVAFYWSEALPLALTTHTGHILMTVHFLLVGYAFVWSLIGTDPGPTKWPAPLRLIVLLATLAAHAFFGLALMQGTWLLAPEFFKTVDLPFVDSLIADQQLGGTIAWGIGELPTMVLALLVTRDWMASDEREARRTDRQADRDDDAALSAYNEKLKGMSK